MGELFKSVGSITSLFKDDMGTAKQITKECNEIFFYFISTNFLVLL